MNPGFQIVDVGMSFDADADAVVILGAETRNGNLIDIVGFARIRRVGAGTIKSEFGLVYWYWYFETL